jgi:hypothetical protein
MAHAASAGRLNPTPAIGDGAGTHTLRAIGSDLDIPGVAANPVMGLQQRLNDAFADDRAKWSSRKTLAFVLLTCGGFWAAVAFGVRALLH